MEILKFLADNLPGWLIPSVEIILLTIVIYRIMCYFKGTKGATVLAGMTTVLLVLNWFAPVLKMDVITWLLEGFTGLLATAAIVIFQPELRRAFAHIGTFTLWPKNRRREAIEELVTAAVEMSRKRIGALIVIERKIGLQALLDDAVKTEIRLNSLVLESLFFPHSPLHDGAVLVREDKIIAARVILPLTRQKLSRGMGTRHRAALGITEEADAVAIVVSEETGSISAAAGGIIKKVAGGDELQQLLRDLLMGKPIIQPEELQDNGGRA